jgi:molecular chaperone IbpA
VKRALGTNLNLLKKGVIMANHDFQRLFDQLESLSIGFAPVFRNFTLSGTNYPPHNIYKGENENEIILEIAVAGFKKDEIEIREHNGEITIQGVKPENQRQAYSYQGIANRSFIKRFQLAEHYETVSAKIEDGLLVIRFEKNIPEEEKPKLIPIK